MVMSTTKMQNVSTTASPMASSTAKSLCRMSTLVTPAYTFPSKYTKEVIVTFDIKQHCCFKVEKVIEVAVTGPV